MQVRKERGGRGVGGNLSNERNWRSRQFAGRFLLQFPDVCLPISALSRLVSRLLSSPLPPPSHPSAILIPKVGEKQQYLPIPLLIKRL